jgi:ADP-ribose pyrophosphatase YjhB (NUDIX family)
MNPRWLEWARQLQAIAQTGLTYAKDVYDMERYRAVHKIAVDMMAHGAGTEASRILGLFDNQMGYATPKVDVRAAVIQDDRILLVREREDGCWTLPGGWADIGDSAAESVIREVREESGYVVTARKLVALYDRDKDRHAHPPIPYHSYKVFFLCDLIGGEPAHSAETDGVGFFGEWELPPLSETRVTAPQIAHLFEHFRNPHWPASFD